MLISTNTMNPRKFPSLKALTFLTAAFIIHNLEEALTIPLQTIESPFSFIHPPDYMHFISADIILTLLGIGIYIAAFKSKNIKKYLFLSTALATTMLFNVFVPHVFMAAYTGNYTPGLLSAVVLNLPLSIVVIVKNIPVFETRKMMWTYISGGLAAGYILFALTMLVTGLFF